VTLDDNDDGWKMGLLIIQMGNLKMRKNENETTKEKIMVRSALMFLFRSIKDFLEKLMIALYLVLEIWRR
jgi:hypothetical protein